MNWTAIVPIKPAAARKTRLGPLGAAERLALSERMLAHVLDTVRAHGDIADVLMLAAAPRATISGVGWVEDEGRGLNVELDAARRRLGDIVVLHADLPMVGLADIDALLATAQAHGGAIAPDRHGTGTNAVALRAAVNFAFRFGPGSRALHAVQLPQQAIVERPGFALDIDTPDDLRLLPR